MKPVLLFLFLLATAGAGAQTHDLLRKSIGGDVELGMADEADFGLPHDWNESVERVDSVIRVNDSTTVLVRGTYRKRSLREGYQPQRLGVARDTVYRDSLYQRWTHLERVRRGLRQRYPQALTDSARLIDQSAARRDSASRSALPPAGRTDEPGTPGVPFVLLTLFTGTGLCLGIARLYRRLSFYS